MKPYYQDDACTIYHKRKPEMGKPGPKKGYKQTQEHIEKRKRFGESHHNWRGDSVSEKGGRKRALRAFRSIGPCQVCGSGKSERHHIDGNTANNSPENIAILCRRCHMSEDGRLDGLRSLAIQNIEKAVRLAAIQKKSKTHCRHGHEYTEANTRMRGNTRLCIECDRQAKKKHRARSHGNG